MNKLQIEIVNIIKDSNRPLSLDEILDKSKITTHSRRLNSSLLHLEDHRVIKIAANSPISKFEVKYNLVNTQSKEY